jgi:hypothetical protein
MELAKTQIIIEQHKLLIDQLTSRNLGFISDPELAQITAELLDEIDRVFGTSGFRSALYLSVSAVEGILKHLIQLNWDEASKALAYPKDNGKPRKIEKVDLMDCIKICTEISLIPKELETTYQRLREFRNYIHPYLELKYVSEINIGISQIAIGILNTTLLLFNQLRFIEGTKWKVITGNPQYTLLNSQLSLEKMPFPRTNSFIITDHYIHKDFTLEFDVEIVRGAIFNVVYNYSSEKSFNMIRIDKRKMSDDGLLECIDKYQWRKKCEFRTRPDPSVNKHHIFVKISGNSLEFNVDGIPLEPLIGDWQYDPKKSIGFFNEVIKVDITSLRTV